MTESKVVPFERGASFLYARAMKQKRAGNPLEALELLRRAAATATEGQDYWMDMADVYADMGCFQDCRCMVLRQLFHHPEDERCFFWLGKCDFEVGNMDEAKRAFHHYLELCPEGELAEEARSDLEGIEGGEVMWRQVDRQSRRRVRRLREIKRCQSVQDYAGADRILSREQASQPGDPQMHISRALNLYMMNDLEGAREQIDQLENLEPEFPGLVVMAAQVYQRLGCVERARQLLDALDVAALSNMDRRAVLGLMMDLGEEERAFRLGRELLREAPYDRMLLHLMAVCACRLGMDAQVADACWQRLCRMNPEDDVARWYLGRLRAGELPASQISEGYQLPRDEVVRRGEVLLGLLQRSPEELRRAWQQEDDVRATLHWALMTDVPQLVESALQLLTIAGGDAAWQLITDFISHTRLGMKYDFGASTMIVPEDYWALKGIEEYMKLRYFTPSFPDMLRGFRIGQRQMIRMAQEVLQEDYGVSVDLQLVLLWAWVDRFQGDAPVVRDLRCGAAVLAMDVLRAQKIDIPVGQLARQFGCSARKLAYYGSWIKNAMNAEGDDEALELF